MKDASLTSLDPLVTGPRRFSFGVLALLLAGTVGALAQCTAGDRNRSLQEEIRGNDLESVANQQDTSQKKTRQKSERAGGVGADKLCRSASRMASLPEIPEASGVAASTRTPGILWINSDAHDPVIFATDSTGALKGRVRIIGAKAKNWEAVAVGRCPSGSCLFIADIGDNRGNRRGVTVYRVPEPLPGDSVSDRAQVFHATYPEGAEDAEAMWVTPREQVYIATKGEASPVEVFRFPPTAQNGFTVPLQKIATLDSGSVKRKERITDAAVSRDGNWVVLRSNYRLFFYRAHDLDAGHPGQALEFDVKPLGEPQGEGVTFGQDGRLYLVGEGGGKGSHPGTFTSLRCNLPS